jgi:hypothetical protein
MRSLAIPRGALYNRVTECRLVSHDPEEEFPLADIACHVRQSTAFSRTLWYTATATFLLKLQTRD